MSGVRACLIVALLFLVPTKTTYADREVPGTMPPIAPSIEQAYLQAAYHSHFAPRVAGFARAAARLPGAVDSMCRMSNQDSLQAARRTWIEVMLAWESAGAVAVGPLLERYTASNIDFWPTRPYMIEAAMRQTMPDSAALRQVGVAARGLPALEWLLWDPRESAQLMADAKVCGYALLLAQDIAAEGQALYTRFAAFDWSISMQDATTKMLNELVNQAIGAVEGFRRKRLFNPAALRNPKLFARSLSDQAQTAWNTQWQSIQALLVGQRGGEAWTFETLLREHGLEAPAARLRTATDQSSAAMRLASPAKFETVQRAAAALLELRRIIEQDVAAGLGIPVSFSDFDGD